MKKIGMKIVILVLLIAVGISTYNLFIKDKINSDNSQPIDSTLGKKVEKSITTDFLMYIDEVVEVNEGILIKGLISKGEVSLDSKISVVGLEKKEAECKVVKITSNSQKLDKAKKGERVELVLETEFDITNFEKGQTAIATGTIKPVFTTKVKIISMNGNINDLVDKIKVVNINTDLDCTASVISERENTIKIKLDKSAVLAEDMEVFLKSDTAIIAKGVIIK